MVGVKNARLKTVKIMFLMDSHIAYINLSHRTDRREHMETELARVGLWAERYPAINTKNGIYTDDNRIINYPSEKTHRMLVRTPGAVGCHLSQTQVMQYALNNNKHAFVMEDDLIFCTDIKARFIYLDHWMQKNQWDIIWLGGTVHINPSVWHTGRHPEMWGSKTGRDAECTEDPRMLRTYGAFSTYAYIVHKDSIEKILDLLYENMQYSMGIDWLFIKLQPQLKTFAFMPGCVKQMDNRSDIGNGMTIFSGFSKLGPYWFQDRLEDFDPLTFDWGEAKRK